MGNMSETIKDLLATFYFCKIRYDGLLFLSQGHIPGVSGYKQKKGTQVLKGKTTKAKRLICGMYHIIYKCCYQPGEGICCIVHTHKNMYLYTYVQVFNMNREILYESSLCGPSLEALGTAFTVELRDSCWTE